MPARSIPVQHGKPGADSFPFCPERRGVHRRLLGEAGIKRAGRR